MVKITTMPGPQWILFIFVVKERGGEIPVEAKIRECVGKFLTLALVPKNT